MDGFRKLRADEIECRVARQAGEKLMLLLYKDARVDQRLLDETFGVFGWQRHHEIIGGNLYCTVSVRNPDTGEWIEKQDVGTESNTEKEKGQASDSFKRACFNLGIGRELYTAPTIWVNKGDYTKAERGITYDKFTVRSIGYDENGNIDRLTVYNTKLKKVVFVFGANQPDTAPQNKKANNSPTEDKKADTGANPEATGGKVTAPDENGNPKKVDLNAKISPKMALQLRMMCKKRNMPEENIYGMYKRASMDDMTIADWRDFGQHGQEILEAWDKEHAA